jgi:uncharacterized HAD superfamily protein
MSAPENKPLLAVDIDEVIFPMVPDLIRYVDQHHKVKISPEAFVSYRIEDFWPDGAQEGTQIFEAYQSQIGLEVAPVKGAQDALGKLAVNYEVIIVTARELEMEKQTKAWLYHHFPDLFKDVHILGKDPAHPSHRPKAQACKELGVAYLVDDYLEYVLGANALGIKSVLFGDYPWNQMSELPTGVVRAKDWLEVLDYFDAQNR